MSIRYIKEADWVREFRKYFDAFDITLIIAVFVGIAIHRTISRNYFVRAI